MKTVVAVSLLGFALASFAAHAAPRQALPALEEPVYATRVDSEIEIGPDGTITRYEPITKLKEPLATRLWTVVSKFRFHPVLVEGEAVTARTRMRLHLVAKPRSDDGLDVSVEHVGFPGDEKAGGAHRSENPLVRGIAKRVAVTYPKQALTAGVSGHVLVAVRLAPDGSVIEAIPRQSALFNTTGREKSMAMALAALERGATETIRKWRFDMQIPPGSFPGPGELTGLVVVRFLLDGNAEPQPGLWMHETRSIERPLPWLEPMMADALPAMSDVGESGHFGASPSRFRLREPAQGAAL